MTDNVINGRLAEATAQTVETSPSTDLVVLEAGAGSLTVVGFDKTIDRLALGGSLAGKTISFEQRGRDTIVKAGDDLLATLKRTALQAQSFTASTDIKYNITDLGALSPNARNVRAVAINDAGLIAGRSEIGKTETVESRTFTLNQGFIWQNGAIEALPSTGRKRGGSNNGQTVTMPGAGGFIQAMNEKGIIVGAADEILGKSTDRALLWSTRGRRSTLEINDFGGIESYFFDINDKGQVAGRNIYGPGSTDTAPNRSQPLVWQNGRSTDLPTLEGDTGTARGINDKGQIVGQIDSDGLNDKTVDTAVLWEKGKGGKYTLTDLGKFGGEQALARDITNAGQIIITTTTGTGNSTTNMLILRDAQGVNTDLGNLGTARGETADINEAGQVVGYSQTADKKDHAYLWSNGKLYDLNDQIVAKPRWNGADVVLSRASGINNYSDIVGYGSYTYTDEAGASQTGTRAYLLTPVAQVVPIA